MLKRINPVQFKEIIRSIFPRFKNLLVYLKPGKVSLILFIFSFSVTLFLLLLTYNLSQNLEKKKSEQVLISAQMADLKTRFEDLKSQDQYKINQSLKAEIENINKTYKDAQKAYEAISDLDDQKGKTEDLKKNFALVLSFLSERNYSSASANLSMLNNDIKKENDRIAALNTPQTASIDNVPTNNNAPGSGYSRQAVAALDSKYLVDIVAADLGSTRVIVDSASDSDCRDNCPVLSLGDYVGRSGAYAGVNGSYFCPATYPQCAGKTNSFDTLLMNKNKKYLNSDNNVYSNVPAVIFLSGGIRFVGRSLEWGRDTGVDGVLANQPLVLSGGNVVFGGDGDPKKGSKGTRSFVGSKGNTVYIGVAHNVTVAEMGYVLKAMGLENALNLDSGGSTALWANGGYKAGPGRNIPNAVLFVRK